MRNFPDILPWKKSREKNATWVGRTEKGGGREPEKLLGGGKKEY